MRLITPLLGVLFLVAAPATAAATCGIDCQATLMHSDCTTPPPGIWFAGDPLTFLGACETCCSPPGGPVECDPTPMDMAFLYVKKDGEPLPGSFSQAGATCDDAGNMFLFSADSGPLLPGSYELIEDQSKLIIAQFEVIEATEIVEEIVFVEEIGEIVEPVEFIDIVAPDIVEEIIEEIWDPDQMATDSAVLEETASEDSPSEDVAPDAPAPAEDTGVELADAGYVTCGTKGSSGSGGCAAGPTAAAPWWLLLLALSYSLRHSVPSGLRPYTSLRPL